MPSIQYSATITHLHSAAEPEQLWRSLEPYCDSTFFQSWSWIGSWLAIATASCELYLYQCHADSELIALGIVSRSRIRRRGFVDITVLALNTVRNSAMDMNVEYNGLLVRRGHENSGWRNFLQTLQTFGQRWDELILNCIPRAALDILRTVAPTPLSLLIEEEFTPWSADIQELAADPEQIFNRFSKNRRWQIRRSFKEYRKEGQITIDAATSTEQALDYFEKLGALHTERWNSVGQAGSFARPAWVEFHQGLIRSAFPLGEIQLLRIRCGGRDIGYIYNFVRQRHVYMLQTGLASEQSNLLRPGYISHILAMQLNAQAGNLTYDFMWGDAEYKSVLAAPAAAIYSVHLQRPRITLMAESLLRRIYRYTTGLRRQPPPHRSGK